MPDFDAGHYFLTVLAPIRAEPLLAGGRSRSRRHLVADALARMPTGDRTVASQGRSPDDPFSRCARTHFARLFVIDDALFNGRCSGGTLLDRIRGVDPLLPQPVDRLSAAYLVFAADFDAAGGDDAELLSYAADLWATMSGEIVDVFQHCLGFDAVDGRTFFDYLKRCQVETTMPFNDYWSAMPDLPAFDGRPFAAAAVIALALGAAAAAAAGRILPLAAGLLAAVLVAGLGVRSVLAAARRPLPKSPAAAPQSDLPTVLKALHVQRAFAAFAIQAQGLRAAGGGDQALHRAFGAFLADVSPAGTGAPTQAPGVIGV